MARLYQEKGGCFIETESLWDALCLESVPHSVISLVGAGGKTSSMFQLARECQARGKKVIVTTSTHIFRPEDYPVVLIQKAEELEHMLRTDESMAAGILVVAGEKDERKNKLSGLSLSETGKLRRYCDVLLVEADGSRQTPLKLPADHEPVIIDETEVVIGCAGLTSMGRPWKEKCFRWERMGQIGWNDRPGDEDDVITASAMARILMDGNGTRKHVGNRCYRIILNQMDGVEQKRDAEAVVRQLKEIWDTEQTAKQQDAEGQLSNNQLVIAASCYL